MSGNPDPMARMADVREKFAAEQAKMPAVDSNGQPIESPAEPVPDLSEQIAAAQKAGDWKAVLQLVRGQLPSPDAA